jgi:hypothetical protein
MPPHPTAHRPGITLLRAWLLDHAHA